MQLCYHTLLKLNRLSKMEMNIFLLLVRYQDECGKVIGAYYKEFMKELGFTSKQTFYNALDSLQKQKLISSSQEMKGDFDITVLDNEGFSKQDQPDYINMNLAIFRTKEFYALKSHEKYMLLDLIRSTKLNRGKRIISIEEFYSQYSKKFHVSHRTIQNYLRTMKKYFHIFSQNGKYYICYIGGKLFEKVKRNSCCKKKQVIKVPYSAAEQKREYLGRVLLRRAKLTIEHPTDALDLGMLIHQYQKEISCTGQNVFEFFQRLLMNYHDLEPTLLFQIKYFHKLIRKELNLERI